MRSIQGVAVPWCYGLYYVRVPVNSKHAFLPWLKGWNVRTYNRPDVEGTEFLENYREHDGKDKNDTKTMELEEALLKESGKFRDQ